MVVLEHFVDVISQNKRSTHSWAKNLAQVIECQPSNHEVLISKLQYHQKDQLVHKNKHFIRYLKSATSNRLN
jgi:hypothetical protein